MERKVKWLLLVGILGVAAYGASMLATPDVAESSPAAMHAAHGGDPDLAQLNKVRRRFNLHWPEQAIKAGYELGYMNSLGVRIITGCIAHPTAGAMGYHYFNKELIDDLVVDEMKPEGLVYSPGPDGRLKLAAVEYVVPGASSVPQGPAEPPSVFGVEMVILNPVLGWWTRHAWIWRDNPAGLLAHWNPDVTCP
jgi:hypothetical protein